MTDSDKLKILFFGELPPNVVHGVSVSNMINIDILAEIGELTVVEEKWDLKFHNRFAFKKVANVFQSISEIWMVAGRQSFDLYYAVLSVSIFGAIKQILFVTAIKIRNRNTQLLFHVHRSDLKTIWEQSFFFKAYIGWLNWLNAGFILLSKMQKEECQDFLNRSFVLYNAIDEEEVYPIDTDKNGEQIRFLYLSNFMKEKGIIDLLNAFQLVEDELPVKLDCYGGDTDRKVKEEMRQIVRRSKQISIHGPVYGSEKNEALNSSDILVLPSYNEGFPLVIIEAMRVNKAIITTKAGYIEELLGKDYPLYIVPGNIQSLHAAIRKAISLFRTEPFKKIIRERYDLVNSEMHRSQLNTIIKTHFSNRVQV